MIATQTSIVPAIAICALLLLIKRSQQLAPLAAAPKAPIASLERVATPELPRASPDDIWRASNASCFQYKGRNYLLVRYVNYELFDTMHRKQKGPGRTRNVLMRLAPGSLTKADAWHELDIVTTLNEPPGRISYGIEDARVIVTLTDECILVGASVGFGRDRVKCDCVAARVDIEGHAIRDLCVLPAPVEGKQQKNWIPYVTSEGRVRLIQYWSPRTTAELVLPLDTAKDPRTCLRDLVKDPGPIKPVFGSSNLIDAPKYLSRVSHDDAQYLAIVHHTLVKGRRKCYSHAVAAISRDERIVALTPWFSFTGGRVEFCTGLAWADEAKTTLAMYVSVLDASLTCIKMSLASLSFHPFS
jgi:hypothetical protein